MVMHVFKRREHAIAATCGCLNRGFEVGPMLGFAEGKVLDERDTGGSGMKTLEQRGPIQPFGRYRRQAQEPDARHPVRRGILDVKMGRTRRL
jgi:hypothetical protein